MSLNPEVRRGGNLPFGMVASVWVCDPRYSTNARTLYCILVTYADTQARNTAMGRPYRRELARQLGVSLATLDRTLDEMEVAGMVTVEERLDPRFPKHHDANIYHLHDAGVMWQGTTAWVDPLPPGVKAADVAKARLAERRKAKREAGIQRTGGVPKGVSTKAKNRARTAEGGSTGAATPGSVGAATLAAPTLLNVYNPLQNPSRDAFRTPEGQVTGGFARAGTRAGSTPQAESAPGGEAANRQMKSPKHRTTRTTAPRPVPGEQDAYDLLDSLGLWERGRAPKMIRDRVRDLLKTGRALPHIQARVNAGWLRAQGPERTRLPEGDPYRIKRPVAYLATVLEMGHDCRRPDCERGTLLTTGQECNACNFARAEREADRAAARIAADTDALEAAAQRPTPQQPPTDPGVPEQRTATWRCAVSTCARPGTGPVPDVPLCHDCLESVQQAVQAVRR
ncbi:hypothetical protein ABT095_14880 [Kitasatospora sp. NPDC002227]|uniref:hypothetical protein n=1 Tax=Kitasatospora sp. NPDC002227 TaxID=3154773 RepID=UPI003331CF19